MQRATFEAFAHLGPQWASLAAGYAAVDWFGRLYLTRSGAAYLATLAPKD